MNKTTTPALRKIFSDILGDMAFIFVSEPEDDAPQVRYTLQARVSYSGPKNGTLQLRCDGRFGATVAANLLGVDPQDGAAEQARLDALKELMNVVCGHMVTELYGTDSLVKLGIPEITPVLPDQPSEASDGAEVHVFVAEDILVELTHVPE